MVFQKKKSSEFVKQEIPSMPRLPRSARGKRSPRKKIENNQMSPIDLLASLAGELLAKREITSSLCKTRETGEKIKQKHFHHGSPFKSDVFDQGSCDESSFVPRSALPVLKSDQLEKEERLRDDGRIEEQMNLDAKTPAVMSSDSSAEILPFEDCRTSSFLNFRDGMKRIVDKDDDENSSGRTHGSSVYSAAFKPHSIGDRRKRQAMNNDDEEIKPVFRAHNLCYTRQRTKNSSFKKRKLFGSSCESNEEFFSDIVMKDNDTKLDCVDLHADLNDAHGRPFTVGQRQLNESTDNPVKLSIKSFKVPELFIEIPSNATVGSLKRTVMEAITAVLSSGARVGVLLRGKKLRDDHKTILQAGISSNSKLDDLGFTLEPTTTRTPPPINSHFLDQEHINKIISPPNQSNFEALPINIMANCTESDIDSVQSLTNPLLSMDRMHEDSKALVPILALNSEALAVVPLCKSGQSEAVQRRIRRPFSVSEVEALVQAVEKLGTGRWRDVKLRAFEDAKHRTYVDLKDKWKTLVHTARISPQQRRGEPVPQGLLDRVLSAHSFWTQQQTKSVGPTEPIISIEPGLILA